MRLRRAFTLVQLLVVLSILGLLMALLMTAVNDSRTPSRGNTCRNNMRQLALAIIQYESRNGVFPGLGMTEPNQHVPPVNVPRPLLYEVLPFMDRSDIYRFYGRDAATYTSGIPADAPYVEVLTCPSHPIPVGTPTAFVYNIGIPKIKDAQAGNYFGYGPWNPANGVFDWETESVSTKFLTDRDGVTTTAMLSENLNAGSWRNPNPVAVGFHWDNYSPAKRKLFHINGQHGAGLGQAPAPDTGPASYRFARPSSNHPGGVNMTFCDGHVTFISQDIDYQVYGQLMSSHGQEATDSSGKAVKWQQTQQLNDGMF